MPKSTPNVHAAFWAIASGLTLSLSAFAADDLKLRDGISFYQDIDSGFPIVATKMEDVGLASDGPTLIFFGAAGDLNTNRQARRVVELYKRFKGQIKFVIVDVDQPGGAEAKKLIKDYYKGYIPFEIIVDPKGHKIWSQIGEVEAKQIEHHMDKALDLR